MEEALADVSFGDWLKRRRIGLGLTQDQLALQINCSTSALRKFESEERCPSAETTEQLADIFNIPQVEIGMMGRAHGSYCDSWRVHLMMRLSTHQVQNGTNECYSFNFGW